MDEIAGTPTDVDVLVEQEGIFCCQLCGGEQPRLYRIEIGLAPTGGWECSADFRAGIRRRLVCDRCLRSFEFRDPTTEAWIAGSSWYLGYVGPCPPIYTADRWRGFIARMRQRRLAKSARVPEPVIFPWPKPRTKRRKKTQD